MLSPIYAVVVTYHTGPEYRACFEALLPQVDHILLIDNGSDASTVALLRQLKAAHPEQVTILLNDLNHGLAAAQNQGIRLALEQGAAWVLLMDDDSEPSPDMVALMLAAYEANPARAKVGCIAPRILDRKVNKYYRIVTGNRWWFHAHAGDHPYYYRNDLLFTIASGTLIKREVFEKIGLMQEEFFIDRIDTEFSARALLAGYCLMGAGEALLLHALGDSARNASGTITRNYAPMRHFMQWRNTVWLLKLHGRALPSYLLLHMATGLCELLRIVFHEANKLEKLRASWRGFIAGCQSPAPSFENLSLS